MNHAVLTDAAQITAEWLGAVLRRSDALIAGHVAGIVLHGEQATWSHNARIGVRYSNDATGERPESLFLKMVQAAEFGPSEIHYLTRDYADLLGAPIPRCYDARYDEATHAYHILMEDLSATHISSRERAITPAFVTALGDALAALHAHRWTAGQIAAAGAALPSNADIARYIAYIRPGLDVMLDIAGDDLRPAWRTLLPQIFARHPPLMEERTRDPRGICLVHGDVNPGNILAPRADHGRVYLVDRQPFDWSLTVWLGVSDLAYLLCTFWDEDVRRANETPLLRAYHQGLLTRGIGDYSWEQLWQDYRLAAVQSVYVAVEWCVLETDRERMRWLWSVELRRAMAAFEELGCAEIL